MPRCLELCNDGRMRLLATSPSAYLLIGLAALGCKRAEPSPVPHVATDASVALPSVAPSASADFPRGPRKARPPLPAASAADAGRPHPVAETGAPTVPLLPTATERLELVAVGKTYGGRIIAFAALGDRVWLSGRGLDAFADGDGPLGKGYDLLEKLPYKQGVHHMEVVGRYPKLFAMRYKEVATRAESPEPTVFVYHAADNAPGTWKESESTGVGWFPHAFAAYKDGAVMVTSQIQRNAGAYYSPSEGPGTLITFIGPDGKTSTSTMGVHNLFMAWAGSAHGDVLSLLGTTAAPPKKDESMWTGMGVQLMRIGPEGVKQVAVLPTLDGAVDMYSISTRQSASATTVFAGSNYNSGWSVNGGTVFVVGADNQRTARTVAGGDSCAVLSAELVSDQLYAIRRCVGEPIEDQLLVVGPDNKSRLLPLPRIVKSTGTGFRAAATDQERAKGVACVPASIVVRPPSDVWVSGQCGVSSVWSRNEGALPIVARLGKPQEPIVIP